MSSTPANPKSFHLSPGETVGFSGDGQREPVDWSTYHEPPEFELLGRLKEAGATFPNEAAALEIIRESGESQGNDNTTNSMRAQFREFVVRFLLKMTKDEKPNLAGKLLFVERYRRKFGTERSKTELAKKLRLSGQTLNELFQRLESELGGV